MFPNLFFILQAVIGFGLLVFVHELGHFLAAKLVGVRVDIFSIGFGPALKRKWRGTEYRLSAIPLGGYVKLAGEEPEPGRKPEPGEFYSKTVGQRALVFGAGVAMNVAFGFLAFVLAYKVGVPVVPAIVGDVEPGSPAWKVGLKRGDRIERIEGVSPPVDFEDLKTTITLADPGEPVRLTVNRQGKSFEVSIYPEYVKDLGFLSAGIYQPMSLVLAAAPEAKESEEAEADFRRVFEAGMRPGDRIIAVKVLGKPEPIPVATPTEFQNAIDESGGSYVRIIFVRAADGSVSSVEMRPQMVGPRRWLGIRFGSNRVRAVRPGSWAERGGLKAGDVVIAVGGQPARSRSEVVAAMEVRKGEPIELLVRRDSAQLSLRLPARPPEEEVAAAVAFEPGMAVDSCMPGFPAEQLGLQPGDEIISADGIEVKDAGALAEVLLASEGKPVNLVWMREGRPMSAKAWPQRRYSIALPLAPDQTILKAGALESCLLGARKAYQWALRVYATIKRLIFGDVSVRHLSGPLSIGYFTYAAAKKGLGLFLYFLAVLSINLAVVNLLPIPVLDGGHLVFSALEKLQGRPLSQKLRSAATYVGISLLVALTLLAFWNDIRSLIFG